MAENEKKNKQNENEEKKQEEQKKTENQNEDPGIVWLRKTMRTIRDWTVPGFLVALIAILLVRILNLRLTFWLSFLLWAVFTVSLLFWYGTYAVKVIKEFENFVVRFLGKYLITCKAGLRIIFPPLMTGDFRDMRELEIDIPVQEVITKDNVVVEVDGLLNARIFDAYKSLFNVERPIQMLSKLGQTSLRNQIGELNLDDALAGRETLGEKVAVSLNIDAGFLGKDGAEIDHKIIKSRKDAHYREEKKREQGWGIKVTRARVKRIDPPDDVQEAMHLIVRASREKKAMIEKAEGEGKAIKIVFNAIHEGKPTSELIALKLLKTYEKMADGQATKIFFPVEVVEAVRNLTRNMGDLEKLKEAALEGKKT